MCRPLLIATIAASGLVSLSSNAVAMGFCTQRQTLREMAAEAPVVVRARLVRSEATCDAKGDKVWKVEWKVEAIVHDDSASLKPSSIVSATLHYDVPKGNYVVLCDYFKGKIEAYRALPATDKTVDYLKGGLALPIKNRARQMLYFFNYLEESDPEIAKDAFQEFRALSGESYDFRTFTDGIPVAKLISWVENKDIPASRRDTYAALLGHCGGDWGALVFPKLIEEACQANNPNMIEGLLIGYTLLRPKNGWSCILQTMGDVNKDFVVRYRALRAARFFREVRPSFVDRNDLIAGVSILLQQSDIADLAIESLRKWGCWDCHEEVLALDEKADFHVPIIHRSILRYALQCPKPKAKEFIRRLPLTDREAIEINTEMLQLESREAVIRALKAAQIW